MEYVFPFPVPEDLSTSGDDDLASLLESIREHVTAIISANEPATDDTITALSACRDLATAVVAERAGRDERAGRLAALSEELDATLATRPEPEGQPEADPEPVVAARPAPTVADISAIRPGTPDLPRDAGRETWMTMVASADVPGFATGGDLTDFTAAARAVDARLRQYPALTAAKEKWRGDRRPITAYDPAAPGRQLTMRNYSRHSAVEFRRNFPDELRIGDVGQGMRVAQYAASERRLPGGSLINSMRMAVDAGRPITASAGWCAPSEVMWDLTAGELETLDGILDLPEVQSSRGGWQIPAAGGPLFATIWSGIGCQGDTHLTEADVVAPSDTLKCCWDIPCPEYVDVRLGVDYVCLTGGLLQRRGFPEAVERFSRGALVALAHKINMGVIAGIVTASGAATVIPTDPSGDDAISGLLSAVDLAIADAKYYARMGFSATMEVVLPMWVLVQMRASGTRRNGDTALVGMTDAQIVNWFAIRKAVPRFVYDWQDAYSGLLTGPGNAAPLTALPLTCQFLVYPAGTWLKAVEDVVNLDTIYDSTNLVTNEYTAIFVEDGWVGLQMTPISRLYTAAVDPSGVVGCCPSAQS